MSFLRGLVAGVAAWKWGGGCFGTIILFVILYWLLGKGTVLEVRGER